MRRIDSSLASIAVVAALLTSTALLAQDPAVKVQAPARKQVSVTTTEKVTTKSDGNGNGNAATQKPAVVVKEAVVKEAFVKEAFAKNAAVPARAQGKAVIRKDVPNPAIEQHLKNLEAQYNRQLRPVLKNELHFLRTLCHLNEDQVKKVTPEGEKALKETVEKYVDVQRAMMTGGFRPDMAYPESRRVIQDSLLAAVKAHLSADQAALYQAEITTRAAERKQAVIDYLVSKLDVGLVLSADQRTKIAEELGSHWNDAWMQSLESYQYADQYMPNLPDNLVFPHLNTTQKSVWRGGQKLNYWGAAYANNMVMDLDDLDAPAVAPPRAVFRMAVPAKVAAPVAIPK
jgi:hypothetical protein